MGPEWKTPFYFVKHVIREYAVGGSTQIEVVSVILQSFA